MDLRYNPMIDVKGATPMRVRLAFAALVALGSVPLWASPALATISAPTASHSWYVGNFSSSVFYARGVTDGNYDTTYCLDDTAFLDFGQVAQDLTGSSSYGYYGTYIAQSPYPFINDSVVANDVYQYLSGWYNTTSSCPRLQVVIGTNNYHECLTGCSTSAAGSYWADVRDTVYLLMSRSWDWQVKIWAGDDIESQGGSWDSPPKVRAFVDGYNAREGQADPGEFLNYGAWFPGYTWSAADFEYVSWGARLNWPFPEVYTQYQADQWVSLGMTYNMLFRGAMGTTGSNWAGQAAFSHLDATLVAHGAESLLATCAPSATKYCDTTIAYESQ